MKREVKLMTVKVTYKKYFAQKIHVKPAYGK